MHFVLAGIASTLFLAVLIFSSMVVSATSSSLVVEIVSNLFLAAKSRASSVAIGITFFAEIASNLFSVVPNSFFSVGIVTSFALEPEIASYTLLALLSWFPWVAEIWSNCFSESAKPFSSVVEILVEAIVHTLFSVAIDSFSMEEIAKSCLSVVGIATYFASLAASPFFSVPETAMHFALVETVRYFASLAASSFFSVLETAMHFALVEEIASCFVSPANSS